MPAFALLTLRPAIDHIFRKEGESAGFNSGKSYSYGIDQTEEKAGHSRAGT